GIFKILGVGVIQMRLLSVVFGFALLLAVFAVGSQLGDDRIGALAAALMLALRIMAGTDTMATGILLLDRARINRYDIAVPVFGWLALWSFNRAERERDARWYAAAGGLAGLSSLSHLIGVFWFLVFALLLFVRHTWRAVQHPFSLLLAGLIAVWTPW